MNLNITTLDFEKEAGLIPAIIQDNCTMQVLMLGYVNEDALKTTIATGNVTFYSRSKKRLWTKGETSQNYFKLVSVAADCDQDSVLIKVNPLGPACHTGAISCFGAQQEGFLFKLEQIIRQKKTANEPNSYVSALFQKGINKIAQKVGEEGVETVIAAINESDEAFLNEASDLVFHLLILLAQKGKSLEDVQNMLLRRSR